jgi:hypothetical protein
MNKLSRHFIKFATGVSPESYIESWGWDLVEWLEMCASIPMITSSNPSGGSEFTFRSDLLLTARGGST